MLNYSCGEPPTHSLDWETLILSLKALAEANRLRIFNLLMEGIQCNCELGERLDMPPNLISHHLAILRQAGLVQTTRDPSDSRWVYYSVNREALERLNATLQTFLDPNRLQPRQPRCASSPQRKTSRETPLTERQR